MFERAGSCFPFSVEVVLSDNGSEFKGAFSKRMKQLQTPHWHTWPKTSIMNPHCERFNRTLQEEFIGDHEDLLFTDIAAFNGKLAGLFDTTEIDPITHTNNHHLSMRWSNFNQSANATGRIQPIVSSNLRRYTPKRMP